MAGRKQRVRQIQRDRDKETESDRETYRQRRGSVDEQRVRGKSDWWKKCVG